MAYVAISRDLIESVKNTLKALQDAELATCPPSDAVIETACEKDSEFLALVQNLVLDALWKGKEDIRAIAGTRLNLIRDNKAVVSFMNTDGTALQSNVSITRPVDGWPAFTFVRKDSFYTQSPEATVTITDHPVFVQARDAASIRQECMGRWSSVRTQVIGFIEKCKSLNEAIKLWPDIVKYVPDMYIERVEKKAERSKPSESDAAKALASIDMDAVAASVTLARMAGAKL